MTEPPRDAAERGAVTAGARFIRRDAIVRTSLLAAATINLFDLMFLALFPLYAVRYLHVRPGELGLVLGAGAIGGVIGALSTKRLAARLGVGVAYTTGALGFTAPLALVPLAGGPRLAVLALLFAAEFLSGVGLMLLDISIGAIFAAVIPDELRSRVTGAFQAVNYGVRPLGALVGGLLGSTLGVRTAMWIAVIGASAGVLWLLPSPIPRYRMPAGETAAGGTPAAGGAGPDQPGTASPRYVPNDQTLPSGSLTANSREP
jgi:MFS family permease